MSNIVSLEVSRRFENLIEAAQLAVDHAPLVGAAIVADLTPDLEEGETLPDFAHAQKVVSRALVTVSRQLDEADNRRKHFKTVEKYRKELLQKAIVKLRAALVDVRSVLDQTMSKKGAKEYFEGRGNLSRLNPPVIQRISARMILVLQDPKLGWAELEDAGYRASAEAAKVRLQNALAEFDEAKGGSLPEKSALVTAQGQFERELEEKRRRLRRLLRLVRGFYEGAGFEKEAAALVLRKRASPKPPEEGPKAALDPRKVLAEIVPWSALPGVSALPTPAAPAYAEAGDAAEVPARRKRHRRRSKKAQQSFSSSAPANGPAEG